MDPSGGNAGGTSEDFEYASHEFMLSGGGGGGGGGGRTMDSNDESNDMMGHGSMDGGEESDGCASYLREQDRFLPIANISRIMKHSIPSSGKIAKDAKECVQECVSEFISFITSEASDRCHQEKRKTINGEDILHAMSNLGFDNYIEPLKIYLAKYREHTMKAGNADGKGIVSENSNSMDPSDTIHVMDGPFFQSP